MYPALVAAVAGSLLLNYFFTPPITHVHDRRGREPAGAGRVRSGRGRGVGRGGPRRPAHPAGGAGQRRRTDAGDRRGQRAARCASPRSPAGTTPGDVRARVGDAARTHDRTARGGWSTSVGDPPCDAPGEADAEVAADDEPDRRAARAPAGGRRPAHHRGVRRAGRGRAAAGAAGRRGRRPRGRSRRPTGCAPRCSPRSATTCGPRSPRPRPPSPACAAPTWPSTRPTGPNCWRPPTSRSTGWPAWWRTCST